MAHNWKPRHDDGSPDHRYSIRLEWTGQPRQFWVARFCDDWLGSHQDFAPMVTLCTEHQGQRLAA